MLLLFLKGASQAINTSFTRLDETESVADEAEESSRTNSNILLL